MRNRKFQKNNKKIQKIQKNTIMNSFLAKIGWKRMRKREIKIIVPFLSYPTYNRKFQQNRKKFKKLKNTIVASLQAIIGWKKPKKRGNKNYHFVPFLPDA